MKKLIALVMIMCLLIGSACSVYADQLAADVFDVIATLLTATENVTLTGNATFSLDGEAFKFVETTYVQDGVNSKWTLNLSSPRADGSLRYNGFTAVANGRYKYGMEVCKPGIYVGAEDNPQSVILRPSAQLTQLTRLGHSILAQLPAVPEEVLSLSEDHQLVVRLEKKNIPDSLSHLISLGVMLAVQRTMNVVDDSISAPPYPEEAVQMEGYISPTAAIVDTTEEYELTQLSVDAKLDEENRFTEVNGSARFVLHTFLEGEHDLYISFAGKISDYGTSVVPVFDAADYGVEPEEGTWMPPEAADRIYGQEEQQNMIAMAQEFLRKAGYTDADLDEDMWTVWKEQPYQYGLSVRKKDGSLIKMLMTAEYELEFFQDYGASWFSFDFSDRLFTIPEDNEDTRREIITNLQDYLSDVRPDLEDRFAEQRFDWGMVDERGAHIYMIESWPLSITEGNIEMIVQTYPDWKIMLFSTISNG